jgi:hypothetical protein
MGLFPNLKVWHLQSQFDGAEVSGQFEALDLSENLSTAYADQWSLGRRAPIAQWLHGELETITFTAKFYDTRTQILFGDPFEVSGLGALDKLKEWVRPHSTLGHPEVLTFWVGDGSFAFFINCTVQSLGGIKYDRPTIFGGLRGFEAQITLREYVPYSLEDGQQSPLESRYHRAKSGDYYEALTQREYGNPQLGDIIRKRNPTKPNLQVGDVVKLPDISAIRKDKVEQKSIALQTGFGKKTTPQKDLRIYMFDARNRKKVSHVIREPINGR